MTYIQSLSSSMVCFSAGPTLAFILNGMFDWNQETHNWPQGSLKLTDLTGTLKLQD